MGNPFRATFIDQNAEGRLVGELNFTDPANQPGGSQPMATAGISLSAAQILALHTTPVSVVAAPGANKLIVPVTAVALLSAGSAPYSNAFDHYVTLSYAGTATDGSQELMIEGQNALTSATDALAFFSAQSQGWDQTTAVNKALVVYISQANPTGGGGGTLRLFVTYATVDVT